MIVLTESVMSLVEFLLKLENWKVATFSKINSGKALKALTGFFRNWRRVALNKNATVTHETVAKPIRFKRKPVTSKYKPQKLKRTNLNLFDQIDIYFFKSTFIFSDPHLFFQIHIYFFKSTFILLKNLDLIDKFRLDKINCDFMK